MSDDAQPYTREEIAEFERELEHYGRPLFADSRYRRLLATAKQGVEEAERLQLRVVGIEAEGRQMLRFMPGDEDLVATLHKYARSFGAEWLLARPDHAAVERGVRETPGALCDDCWEHLCSRCQERLAAVPQAPTVTVGTGVVVSLEDHDLLRRFKEELAKPHPIENTDAENRAWAFSIAAMAQRDDAVAVLTDEQLPAWVSRRASAARSGRRDTEKA